MSQKEQYTIGTLTVSQIVPPGATAPTIAALTDNSGGTASNTIAAIGATYSQTEVRNAIASLAAKQTAILNALKAIGVAV